MSAPDLTAQVYLSILVSAADFFCCHTDIIEYEFNKCRQPANLVAHDHARRFAAAYNATLGHLHTKALFDVNVNASHTQSCEEFKNILKNWVLPLLTDVLSEWKKYQSKTRIALIEDSWKDSKTQSFSEKFRVNFEKFIFARMQMREWLEWVRNEHDFLESVKWSRAEKILSRPPLMVKPKH